MKEKMAFIFRGNPFLYLLNHQECISYLVPQLFVNIIILNSTITKQTYRCLLANGTHMCVCVGLCVTGGGANASIGHRFFFKLTVIMGKGNMGSILKLSSFIYLFIY